MTELEILTVTYAPDFELFKDLRASITRFTGPQVVHRVVVDDADKGLFQAFESESCKILSVSDILPRNFVKLPSKNLLINTLHPWPPVRGWVYQQMVKLIMASQSDAEMVLLMDSDVVLTRPVAADSFRTNGNPNFFRLARAIHSGMGRHVLWHKTARELLGLSTELQVPLNDYVDSFNVWVPEIVEALCSRIAKQSSRSWQTAFSARLHVSEFILYGVFVDEVLGGLAPVCHVDRMRCHNYWDEVPLDLSAALSFVDQARDDDIGLMISAKSNTEISVRREAIARAQGR